ncbi:MAG TPA: helix-turn-helix transcriptional regulator [Burkholderiaceae bacterium]|nr:helix-turn-helix transcriptional regulator [Burkholderiaceae bacterium]
MFNDVTHFDKAMPGLGSVLYLGPDRRRNSGRARHWLAATLDEIDYGMLLLTDISQVSHTNHAAQAELDAEHPLQLVGRELCARRPQDAAPLADALQAAAQRGLRKLLTLGEGAQRVGVSVVPLGGPDAADRPVTLVMIGKRHVCGALSVQGFAQAHRLTGAETRVLDGLCRGTPPTEIARQLGVAISTVRTQIGNIRHKTGAQSIRALVRQVAVLPPLMGVLRSGAGAGAGRVEHDVRTLLGV